MFDVIVKTFKPNYVLFHIFLENFTSKVAEIGSDINTIDFIAINAIQNIESFTSASFSSLIENRLILH